MWWLWIAGPLAFLIVFLLTAPRRGARDRVVEAWRRAAGAKRVAPRALPGELAVAALEVTGGGEASAAFELLPRMAYLLVHDAGIASGSDVTCVVMKLGAVAPTFTVRPLAVLDGRRVPNTGVQFKNDPDFMEAFQVQGQDSRAIGRWLTRSIREALQDLPDGWLSVSGRAMALSVYGARDAERFEDVLAIADELFAEHGAEPELSLLRDGEDEAEEAPQSSPEGESADRRPAASPADGAEGGARPDRPRKKKGKKKKKGPRSLEAS